MLIPRVTSLNLRNRKPAQIKWKVWYPVPSKTNTYVRKQINRKDCITRLTYDRKKLIKSNLPLYSLYYAEACNELAGPISAPLRPDNTAPFEEMLQQWRAVGNSASDLTGTRFEPQTSRSWDERVTTQPTARLQKLFKYVQLRFESEFEGPRPGKNVIFKSGKQLPNVKDSKFASV